mmetsp:Transcript_25337/g.42080  ORF Transcript_25337/g.42080 Transcript_25337/m.42080 type:complete len:196 (-) Transcript_25337:679-1266(-)|eukprot:CAMPEP_0119017262 /NCGR_PEP_ID=MMETSP1176-20130426/15960_1 /TAXON_ID=265551 /ORGANISM="Synedropsis recta cf, Strain CCMP1620" /LENGTH=195 /DNA_ID=CAMNT_0006970937 /DNA_START=122 /DNA_END=712 /DNA_ORIENTATION=-
MIFRRTISAPNVNTNNPNTGGNRSLQRPNSSRSVVSRPVPYPYLLKAQLARFSPLLRGDYELNNNFNFSHHGYHVSFDISSDCHTFMVSAIACQVSTKDAGLECLATRYLDVERSLIDIRMEWNEDNDILIYQNLPIGLIQEDCLEEFQAILSRFLSELSVVSAALQQVSSRSLSRSKTNGHKPRLMRIFSGRAA